MSSVDLFDLDFPPEWERAVSWFEEGDPSVLAGLIIKGESIPLVFRKFVSEVITGKRRPPSVGKARKVLNADHKNILRECARSIASVANFFPEENKFRKEQAIATVRKLSGASLGTVKQEWKKANSKYAQLDRRNKAILLTLKERRISREYTANLRELSKKNDPFNGSR